MIGIHETNVGHLARRHALVRVRKSESTAYGSEYVVEVLICVGGGVADTTSNHPAVERCEMRNPRAERRFPANEAHIHMIYLRLGFGPAREADR